MPETMTGAEKAAVLMVLLGEETSAGILRHFEEPDIFAIGRAVSALREIRPDVAERVLGEYRDRILSHREGREGGPDAARRILTRTLSPERLEMAAQTLPGGAGEGRTASVPGDPREGPFSALAGVKSSDLGQALQLEHPQTAALVLLHLPPGRAAGVLAAMGEDAQAEITARLSRVSSVSAEVTREISDALTERFEALRAEGVEEKDGVGAAAEILKKMDRARSRSILGRLESLDAESAETLRSRVYTFEMLLAVNDRGIQEILKGVDSKQLALALKGSTPEVSEKFFRNMSTRAAELVKDEMEYLGVAKVKDVEAGQKEVLEKALRLEEEGKVTFDVSGGEGVGV